MNNKIKRVLLLLTAMTMLGSSMPVYAVNNGVTNEGENHTTSANEIVGDGEKDTTQAAEQRLNYIYVESPYLETPETQRIVVSWGDGTEKIKGISLNVRNGSTVETWEASRNEEYLYLFEKEYSSETQSGTYEVESLMIETGSEENTYQVADLGIEVLFGVNREYEGIDELELIYGAEEAMENSIEEALEEAQQELNATTAYAARTFASEEPAALSSDIVVALDPGHDSKHAGASANGLKEEVLTLKIANYCKEELEKYDGVTVYMTRTTADCPYPTTKLSGEDIKMRADAAAAAGAKIFVSFHLNSALSSGAKGAEIIVPNSNWKPEVAESGTALAESILDELTKVGVDKRKTPIYSKDATDGAKYEDGSLEDLFSVQISNKHNGIPGIIIEHAFITNTDDVSNFLSSEEGLKKLGVADATGIAKYLGLVKETHTTGWSLENGKWYYYDQQGYRSVGWKAINGYWYWFTEDGAMQTGWLTLSGNKFYLSASGACVTGWQTIEGKKYYFDVNGYMQTGTQVIDGVEYRFDGTTGELIEKRWEGWSYENGKWYYYDQSGYRSVGWKAVNGYWYWFAEDGVMQTGWLTLSGNKFYLNASGACVTGWQTIEGKKYYFDVNGYMQTGTQVIDGVEYQFDETTGELIEKKKPEGWSYENGKWYYYDANGWMMTGWVYEGGKWYYMDSQGVMQTVWICVDGKW